MEQNQLTKQERRELRQQEKQQFQISQQRKRSVKKITTWTIVILIIGASGYGLYYLASQPEKPRPGESFPILGQEHISVGASHPAYNSNPPTSGWHYAQPADWGVYQNELPDEQLIHNLEHGGIWISYQGISDEQKSILEEIGKANRQSVIVSPRSTNNDKIVVASWGKMMKLETADKALIQKYIMQYKNQSPEKLAR